MLLTWRLGWVSGLDLFGRSPVLPFVLPLLPEGLGARFRGSCAVSCLFGDVGVWTGVSGSDGDQETLLVSWYLGLPAQALAAA